MLHSLLLVAAVVAPQSNPPQHRLSKPVARMHATAMQPAPVAPVAATNPAEREYNGSRGWADPIGPGTVLGTLTDSFDLDYYRIEVASPSVVTATMAANGAMPAQTPSLTLFDADRSIIATAFGRLFPGGFPAVAATVPAGTYYLECRTLLPAGGGDYSLTVATAPAGALPALPVSGTVAGTLAAGGADTWMLTVPGDTNVQVQASGGPLDLFFDLQGASGGSLFTVDDSASGTDPVLDADLPAGTYRLVVTENSGAGGIGLLAGVAGADRHPAGQLRIQPDGHAAGPRVTPDVPDGPRVGRLRRADDAGQRRVADAGRIHDGLRQPAGAARHRRRGRRVVESDHEHPAARRAVPTSGSARSTPSPRTSISRSSVHRCRRCRPSSLAGSPGRS